MFLYLSGVNTQTGILYYNKTNSNHCNIMKRLFPYIAAAMLIGAASCSNQDMPDPVQNNNSDKALSEGALEAVAIADDFLGRSQSRSGETPQVLYILNEAKSRSEASLPDTLAYVVNYPEQSGYAVVMNSDRPDRVLAFSETGNFDMNNEVVNEYFTSRIGSFMATPYGFGVDIPVGPGTWLGSVTPVVVTPIYEDVYPYYYYVQKYHSGFYAGTGPVAIAKVMLHAKDKVENCFGTTLYCKSIRNAYTGTASVAPDPTYSLANAKNMVAGLIANLANKLDAKYYSIDNHKRYSMSSANAINYLRSMGYEIATDMTTYKFSDVHSSIGSGNIVVMYGKRELDEYLSEDWMYDYWVCDGTQNVMKGIGEIVNYIHCSWGNSTTGQGDNDGYFLGTCFEYGDEAIDCYFPIQYFAVKLEK